MSNKITDKFFEVFNIALVYFSIIGILVTIEVSLGSLIGREYLKYEVLLNQMVIIGILFIGIVTFLSDLFFSKLKYTYRLIFCVCLSSVGIEVYSMYKSWVITGKIFSMINNNQMFYMFFFVILIVWILYSQFVNKEFKKHLVQYQNILAKRNL